MAPSKESCWEPCFITTRASAGWLRAHRLFLWLQETLKCLWNLPRRTAGRNVLPVSLEMEILFPMRSWFPCLWPQSLYKEGLSIGSRVLRQVGGPSWLTAGRGCCRKPQEGAGLMQEGVFHEGASFWSCKPTGRSSWVLGRLPSIQHSSQLSRSDSSLMSTLARHSLSDLFRIFFPNCHRAEKDALALSSFDK